MQTLRDLMTTDLLTVRADQDVRAALETLEGAWVRHLPVLQGTRVVGMLSDRDLRPAYKALWDEREGHADDAGVLDQHVTKLMRTDVLHLPPDGTVADAIDVMLDFRVGAVPIVEAESLVGIVSYVDVLQYVKDLL